jgi:Trypsin
MSRILGFLAAGIIAANFIIEAKAADFEMVPPGPGDGSPSVIGGEPANPADYPATFIFRTSGGCTSTAVGNRAILTAAHCVTNGAKGTITLADGTKAEVVCEHHPEYGVNRTKDFALCVAAKAMGGFPFENVNTSIAFPKVGDEIRLLGFGCREDGGHDGAFGVLYTGPAKVIRLPKADDIDTITRGGAAVCFGDSGGGAFVDLTTGGAVRSLFAVNSRGDISQYSYLSTTATLSFVSFAVSWAAKNGVDICGVSAGANGCR